MSIFDVNEQCQMPVEDYDYDFFRELGFTPDGGYLVAHYIIGIPNKYGGRDMIAEYWGKSVVWDSPNRLMYRDQSGYKSKSDISREELCKIVKSLKQIYEW